MKISHIEHLGIAVESIEEALPYFENVLGLKCYNIEEVADQKVKTAFLKILNRYDSGDNPDTACVVVRRQYQKQSYGSIQRQLDENRGGTMNKELIELATLVYQMREAQKE